MKLTYPAIFHHENESYWVEFPDLIGCNSFGDTVEETLKAAQEALEGYALTLLEEGKKLPEPSDITNIQIDENSFTSFVQTDLSAYLNNSKAVKKTLTIPEWLNNQAVANGINFSKVLQEALIKQLNML